MPSLYRQPDPFAVDMLARIHTVLLGKGGEQRVAISQDNRVARDEVVAVLGQGNRIEVAGLVSRLSDGNYTGELRPHDRRYPVQPFITLDKKENSITLILPGPGLYDLKINDALNTPRVDLFIAAISSDQASTVQEHFHHARAFFEEWNQDYQGWPIHAFQRAYLESLILNIDPLQAGGLRSSSNNGDSRSDVASEPEYSPRPGNFATDTSVTLRCSTPGAVIHYTVDNSQPVDQSPIYTAPIMVNGTELMIKAFASVPGKRDSPVVTGIFRIKSNGIE
ncbi:MAG: chitobiase/beta-hexosaminidase C-terminal domain-containing protein [Acidobacteriaceae bacterium]|nr:chitobiase/beta-hexosaminidase C-terminal domain-containing protein [Acidobacteriaceae bacterium]